MKVGRNDSCPCGSGRKYKRCCLLEQNASVADLQEQTWRRVRQAIDGCERSSHTRTAALGIRVPSMKTRELYSIEDARFLLGEISRVTIYAPLNNGELASVVIGRRRFIPAGAITAFIATTSTNTAPSERRASGRHRPVQMPLQLEPAARRAGRPRTAARR
jgi:SEC-C motif-containing protein